MSASSSTLYEDSSPCVIAILPERCIVTVSERRMHMPQVEEASCV